MKMLLYYIIYTFFMTTTLANVFFVSVIESIIVHNIIYKCSLLLFVQLFIYELHLYPIIFMYPVYYK